MSDYTTNPVTETDSRGFTRTVIRATNGVDSADFQSEAQAFLWIADRKAEEARRIARRHEAFCPGFIGAPGCICGEDD